MHDEHPPKALDPKDMTFSFYACVIAFGLVLAFGTVALVYFLIDNFI